MDVDVEPWGDALKAIDLAADIVYEVQLRAIMVPPVPGGDILVAGHRRISEHAVDEVTAGLAVPEDGRFRDLDVVVERRPVVERGVDAPPHRRVGVGTDPARPVRHNHVAVDAQGAREIGRREAADDAMENSTGAVDVRLRDLRRVRPRWQHHGPEACSLSLSLSKETN